MGCRVQVCRVMKAKMQFCSEVGGTVKLQSMVGSIVQVIERLKL